MPRAKLKHIIALHLNKRDSLVKIVVRVQKRLPDSTLLLSLMSFWHVYLLNLQYVQSSRCWHRNMKPQGWEAGQLYLFGKQENALSALLERGPLYLVHTPNNTLFLPCIGRKVPLQRFLYLEVDVCSLKYTTMNLQLEEAHKELIRLVCSSSLARQTKQPCLQQTNTQVYGPLLKPFFASI